MYSVGGSVEIVYVLTILEIYLHIVAESKIPLSFYVRVGGYYASWEKVQFASDNAWALIHTLFFLL